MLIMHDIKNKVTTLWPLIRTIKNRSLFIINIINNKPLEIINKKALQINIIIKTKLNIIKLAKIKITTFSIYRKPFEHIKVSNIRRNWQYCG